MNPPSSAVPLIGFGSVRHARLRPRPHAFSYASYFLLLPMRSLHQTPSPALARNRFGWLAFHDADHGDGQADALGWFDGLLAQQGIDDADGEVWLQTFPRVLGYAFKPVSFWYAHRADGTLAAVVAEVNSTFGERHCYVLHGDAAAAGGVAWGRELTAAKVLHVSPFCRVEGHYRFRFLRTGAHPSRSSARKPPETQAQGPERIVARIDHHDANGPLLRTSISGRLEPLSAASARRALWSMPLMTFGVVLRIHWQALRLWLKRVPFFHKPAPAQALFRR